MKIDSSEIPGAAEIYLFQNFMFMQRKELELLFSLYSFGSHMYSDVFNVSFQIIYNILFQSGDLVFQWAVNKELSLKWWNK